MPGILYIIGTPLGNSGDITYRAVDTLKSVDLVVCEDVSNSHQLLKRYEIDKPTTVYHAGSDAKKEDFIVAQVRSGKNLAYITDAGMPAVSDPGSYLVDRVRKEIGDDALVVIPGVTAMTTAVAASGLNLSQFVFYGFAPHKKGRETLFRTIGEREEGAVLYESVHRIQKLLASLVEHLDANRRVVVARELTKIYEQIIRGTPQEVSQYFIDNQDKVRGEFVVLVERS